MSWSSNPANSDDQVLTTSGALIKAMLVASAGAERCRASSDAA